MDGVSFSTTYAEVNPVVSKSMTTAAHRCTDENSMKRTVGFPQPLDLQWRFERLNLRPQNTISGSETDASETYLGSPPVPRDGDRDTAEELLPALLCALNRRRKQNGSGARPPHRLLRQELLEGLEQTRQASEQRNGRRF